MYKKQNQNWVLDAMTLTDAISTANPYFPSVLSRVVFMSLQNAF